MIVFPIGWIQTGYLGGRIVARKGYQPKFGIVLGLFGIIGLLIAIFLPITSAGREIQELEFEITQGPRRANCPNCGKQIKFGAEECPFCQYVITLSAKRK